MTIALLLELYAHVRRIILLYLLGMLALLPCARASAQEALLTTPALQAKPPIFSLLPDSPASPGLHAELAPSDSSARPAEDTSPQTPPPQPTICPCTCCAPCPHSAGRLRPVLKGVIVAFAVLVGIVVLAVAAGRS